MCGIIGSLAIDQNAPVIEHSRIEFARDQMLKRGPDAAGLWEDSEHRIILAHRRLSIIDLSQAANQPFVSPCGKHAIAFNGEIYNYKELRSELRSKGHKFTTESDTEVLLASCIEFGIDVCKHLRGMFTFAFWNGDERSLLLARDHFGIKPLYIAQHSGRLHFASQVSALLALEPSLQYEPSLGGHIGFFLWGHVPGSFTLYKNIRSIPPGQLIHISNNGKQSRTVYFDLATCFQNKDESDLSYSNILDIVRDSIRNHLIADVPVGIFLSAGIDSSIIASAAIHGSDKIRTLTLGFPEFRNTTKDETGLASQTAKFLGTVHTERWIDSSDFSRCIDDLFVSMDQPTIDGVNTYFICREAKASGLKVVLSGLGGDEMFQGYSTFNEVPQLYNLVSKFGFLSKPVGSILRSLLWPLLHNGPYYKYAYILESGHSFEGAYHLRRGLFMPSEIPYLFGKKNAKIGLEELSEETYIKRNLSGISNPKLKVQWLEMTSYLSDQLLRDSDWASMAHSIELRVPFIDSVLFKSILSATLKSRPFLKHDLADIMPKQISSRVFAHSKTGFNIPVQNWINKSAKDKRVTLREWASYVYSKKTGNQNMISNSKLKSIS